MRWRAWACAAFVALNACVHVARATGDAPLEPRAGSVVRDRDFGVRVRGFGLDRRVEMLQWQRVDGRYRLVWHDAVIDARMHDAAHANPRMSLRSRRWWSDSARINRRPIDRTVLQALGIWKTIRPDFSALPGKLADRYQPEGDGLGSADNPLEPEVGDVRVTWRELTLPPLDGRVELRRGEWQLRGTAPVVVAPSPLDPIKPPVTSALTRAPVAEAPAQQWALLAASLAAGAAFVLWWAFRVRRRRRSGH